QRQAERLQILRGEAGRHLAACEEVRAPQAEEIFLFFTGEAHRGVYRSCFVAARASANALLSLLRSSGLAALARGWGNKPRAAYSTTFGTKKKPSCAAGSFWMTSSGMPPSRSTSVRLLRC